MPSQLEIQKNVSLAQYTTFKIGGLADFFVVARTQSELQQAILYARESKLAFFILGQGANILISDRGIQGLVILNQAKQTKIHGNQLTADSGTTITELIALSSQQNLSGLEHFAGIPSSVGGALWQNLHFLSPDRQNTIYIANILQQAKILDEEMKIIEVSPEFFQFAYDDSILHHRRQLVVLEATFELTPLGKDIIQDRIQANLAWRAMRHPDLKSYPSAGSIFKKIEGVGAGRLISQAGLVGQKVGGAMVSTKHSNFIVNTGDATASDVIQLIKLIQERVQKVTGYQLQPEINLVGEWE